MLVWQIGENASFYPSVIKLNRTPPPCKAVSLASRCSSTFFSHNTLNLYSSHSSHSLIKSANTMGYVRKTLRKEHETPKRARFRCLVEQRFSQAEAARRVKVDRTTALKWLH
jgi:hypothetical protein